MSAILIRTVLFYIILSVLVRLMGKRQIGELQLPEFTAAILLSELAALPITDRDIPILHGILALAVVVSLEVIVSFICRKCPRIRKLLDGEPVFLIYKGEVLEHNLTRTRISLDEIFAQVRNDGYRDISEVEYVILEQTGKMSVLPKANTATVTPGDLALNKARNGNGARGGHRRQNARNFSPQGQCDARRRHPHPRPCGRAAFRRALPDAGRKRKSDACPQGRPQRRRIQALKHFIIAVILLLAVVALTTINALTIVRRMEDFQTRLEGLPETEADAAALDPARLDELYDEWSSLRRYIALSTHLYEVERLDEAVTDMRAYWRTGSFADYYTARERAMEAAYDLMAAEKFSLDNII